MSPRSQKNYSNNRSLSDGFGALVRPTIYAVALGLSSLAAQANVESQPVNSNALGTLVELHAPTTSGDVVSIAYALTEQDLLWSKDGRLLPAANAALALLAAAESHGLPSSHYGLARIQAKAQQIEDPTQATQFDHDLTRALWRYAQHITEGVAAVGPHAMANSKVKVSQQTLSKSLIRGMVQAIKRNRIDGFFKALSPHAKPYRELQEALALYRSYQARGGWATLPTDSVLRLGSNEPEVADLRSRLEMTDSLTISLIDRNLFDVDLETAVKRFQYRHGLTQDGIVGGKTRRALNESVERKIDRLALNLDRWRQLPRNLPRTRVMVNIPEYQLRLYQDHEKTLEMRVVVGSKENPTPVIHGRLDHLVFNPYWYPTRRITRREILPSLQQDPNYLSQARMEVLDGRKPIDASNIAWNDFTGANLPYRFRQLPGPKNSLGKVKFIFPNEHAVYMHDTPITSQFAHDARAYSHGCIRLENPKALASAILGWERGWNEQDVERKMTGNRPKFTKFKETLDIYLVYLTANVNNGDVFFYSDIYAQDRTPEYLLAHRLRPLPPVTTPDVASIVQPAP